MSYQIEPISEHLANQLMHRGIYLSPKPKGYFTPLVSALEDQLSDTDIVSEEGFRVQANRVLARHAPNPFARASFEELDGSDETTEIGDVVTEVSDYSIEEITHVASQVMETLKDRVIPTVNEIFDTAYDQTTDAINTGGITLAIRPDESEAPLFSNPFLLELLKNHETIEGGDDQVSPELIFPENPTFNLRDVVTTTATDVHVDLLNATHGRLDEVLSAVYQHCYLRQTVSDLFGENARAASVGLPALIVAFLMARYLASNIPDDVSGVTQHHYEAYIMRLVNYYGSVIERRMGRMRHEKRMGRLILEFPDPGSEFTPGASIVVSASVYNEYLEQGGENDAIYGAMIRGRGNIVSKDQIQDEQDQLIRAWHFHVESIKAARADDFQNRFIFNLRKTIVEYAKNAGTSYNQKGMDRLIDLDINLTPDNVYSFTQAAVVECFFNEPSYLRLLNRIDALEESAKKRLSQEDIIRLGMIDWLVEWALSHVAVNH